MIHYLVTAIGLNKGAPRVWLQGVQLAKAGFEPGCRYVVTVLDGEIRLELSSSGSRLVSRKRRGERELPVIDLNSREILALFEGMDAVRVVMDVGEVRVMPLASEVRRRRRIATAWKTLSEGDALSMGSISHGGGILSHAIHSGLFREGIDARLRFANEIRDELLEHARQANDAWEPDTVSLSAPLQELVFDPRLMRSLPNVDILEAGLPCSGASVSGRAKRKLALPEDHPEVGHLVAPFIAAIAILNPLVVVLENVPQYENTASAAILRNMLRDMGYEVREYSLNGQDYGAIEDRTRYCLIGLTRGIQWSEQPMVQKAAPPALSSVLEPFDTNDPRWSNMAGLKAKEVRDTEAGKGFKMQTYEASANRVGTITKGYAKVRSTDPKLRHPSNPDLLRQFTPVEHARMKQIPPRLVEGLSETVAHEVLGQSIIYKPFEEVGAMLARTLKRWMAGLQVPAVGVPFHAKVACG